MKNLFATVSYSFNSFYNNLNTRGQMTFSIIMFLILVLCVLLFITYVMQGIKEKRFINKIKKENKKIINEIKPNSKEILENKAVIKEDEKKAKSEIENIKDAISDALKKENPIDLTNFEEDQEKTAIISIDELMKKAEELNLTNEYEDDNTGINYLEKYNLQPAEVELLNIQENDLDKKNNEVKAFKVSQVISPIYGVKKEVIKGNESK